MRLKTGGGNAGNKGIKSIEAHVGKEFRRLRLGIGHPGAKELVNGYVLHDFAKADREWLDPLLAAVAENAPLLAAGDDANFMNRVHLALADGEEAAGEEGKRSEGAGAGGAHRGSGAQRRRGACRRPEEAARAGEQVLAVQHRPRTGRPVRHIGKLCMGFRCGIVGLPNVGKSTLFNALTRTAAAQAANYPFCTIEPNTGEVAVPDARLDKLAELAKSVEIVPTRLSFVDIAGLVRGASKGEGLGNQFLANIREVEAVAHVVRCFEDPDVVHVEGHIDPLADIEVVETELMLADLDSLERRVTPLEKRAKGNDKEAQKSLEVMQLALALLARRQAGTPRLDRRGAQAGVPRAEPPDLEARALRLQRRRSVGGHRQRILAKGRGDGGGAGSASGRAPAGGNRRNGVAAEAAGRRGHLGRHRIGDRAIAGSRAARIPGRAGIEGAGPRPADPRRLPAPRPRDILHRRTEGSARLDRGARRQSAAGGRRHPYGFRARLHPRPDHRFWGLVALGGEVGARDAGKARDEGKDYVVQDGDVMLFKFNV